MAKKKTSTRPAPAPAVVRANKKMNEAKETKRFMVAIAIGTLLLVLFLYFILMR